MMNDKVPPMSDNQLHTGDIFLQGDLVYLRQPDIQKDVLEGHWHTWFNDPDITQHLVHGTQPVNREQQAAIVQSEIDNPNSLLLAVFEKKTERHVGIIALTHISHALRSASMSIVFGEQDIKGAALEALALITKHGFDRLNLQRIYAGQHADHWSWMNSMELIGYQIEGYHPHYAVRNGKAYDTISYGITSERFYDLQENRGGNILSPSVDALYAMKSAENKTEKVRNFFRNLYGPDTTASD